MQKILLVEDNALNRDMLTRRLKKAGYEVVGAGDGQEAITLAEEGHPNLILMDMSLPVLDGWEATRHLKGNAATKAIPIIALTAHAMVEDLESTLKAGCDDYDTKPIDFQRLMDKIHHLLPEEA